MNDGDGRTLGALRAGKEGMVELCHRRRGGMAPKPSRAALTKAFALFDTDGDGLLSPEQTTLAHRASLGTGVLATVYCPAWKVCWMQHTLHMVLANHPACSFLW